jgi:hypothetical protein
MTLARLTIFILGLTAATIPARASLTYYSSQSTFENQATVTDALTVSSLITFTGTLSEYGSVANDEYIDLTTGVEFIAFNGTGTTNKAFTVSGGVLNTPAGDTIEIILPAGTYGVGTYFTTTDSNGETVCMDPTTSVFNSCYSGGTFIPNGGSGYVGTLNDNPTPATMTTIWLNQLTSGNIDLTSFEIATQGESQTPDPGTWLTLGAGLILIAGLRRSTGLFRFLNR